MRPLRFLILLLVLATAMVVALIKPLPIRAGTSGTSSPDKSAKQSRRQRRLMTLHKREKAIVRYARRFIGTPYSWGGTSPRTGFDCSGFVRYVYGHFGISLPHSSFGDLWRGRRVSRRNLKPGDVVFFDRNNHVGIYIGGNRIIHAPHSGTVVQITTMNGWYGETYDAARRLIAS